MAGDILRNKQAVLFDISGTLLDFHGGGLSNKEKDAIGLQRLSDFLEDNLSVSAPPSMLRKFFLEPWYAAISHRREDNCEVNADSYLLGALNLPAGPPPPISEMIKAFSAFMLEYSHRATLTPNARRLFESLRASGTRIGIVANTPVHGAVYRDILAHHGLAEYVSVWAFSYDLGFLKPDPRIYEYAMQVAGASPEECAMVGDGIEEDMQGAALAGMTTIWYNPNGVESQVEVDRDIRNLSELIYR